MLAGGTQRKPATLATPGPSILTSRIVVIGLDARERRAQSVDLRHANRADAGVGVPPSGNLLTLSSTSTITGTPVTTSVSANNAQISVVAQRRRDGDARAHRRSYNSFAFVLSQIGPGAPQPAPSPGSNGAFLGNFVPLTIISSSGPARPDADAAPTPSPGPLTWTNDQSSYSAANGGIVFTTVNAFTNPTQFTADFGMPLPGPSANPTTFTFGLANNAAVGVNYTFADGGSPDGN